MMTNKDITVIIPLHIFNEDVSKLLNEAIESVPKDVKIVISCFKGLKNEIVGSIGKKNKNIEIQESEKSDFCSIINNTEISTEWFSILEYDDIYSDIWFKTVCEYETYYPEYSIMLPLEDLYDFTNGKFVGNGNEAPWASSFSNSLGEIDNDCLQEFYDFYMTGGMFKTSDFKEVGMLKASMKLTFWQEFMLRATNLGKKIYVIPKVGYVHMLNRKGSLIDEYKNTILEKEADFWFKLARKECFFKEDRNKTYDVSE